jgi:glycerol-3-phosphate acyltransferase PlsY
MHVHGLIGATLIVSLVGGYLLGSIPFGLIATRLGGAGDIRTVGSGNIGATNVLRTGRRDLALITLFGDGAKGAVAVLLATWVISPTAGAVAGAGAFLGHLFPLLLGFRGGKGVATAFGILLAIAWPVALAGAVVWLLVAALTRFSSLASLETAAIAPALLVFLHQATVPRFWLVVGMAILIFIRHHQNIRRLIAGTEPRIGAPKASTPA